LPSEIPNGNVRLVTSEWETNLFQSEREEPHHRLGARLSPQNGQAQDFSRHAEKELSMKRDLKEAPRQSPANWVELEDGIRRRAYELYEERGRGAGLELDDWVKAEAEVRESRDIKRAA
jgi:hypothetical protein